MSSSHLLDAIDVLFFTGIALSLVVGVAAATRPSTVDPRAVKHMAVAAGLIWLGVLALVVIRR